MQILSTGNSGVAVKSVVRRSSQDWPWKKRHEKQAVDNCFQSIEQLKCLEDLKLHGDHGSASGECGLCRSMSRTLFEKISRHNWQCPPETEIYVATGFFDPESFQFRPPNLIHLKLTAGGMELLDVVIFAFYPSALTTTTTPAFVSASWDLKKSPNSICGLQRVNGSHLYIKTGVSHQRANSVDQQLIWSWEFFPTQPTIMDPSMKEIYQKSLLQSVTFPIGIGGFFSPAEKFAESLLNHVTRADKNAGWCLMRARGEKPFINDQKDSTIFFHCEEQKENFFILNFPKISELKTFTEQKKFLIYKQLKETYKMPKEAAIYRLKIFFKQNGFESWNFAIGNAIRIVYLPLNMKQFCIETSYKLTNILLWQKSESDQSEKDQVVHL